MVERRNIRIDWKVVKVGDIRMLVETFTGICTQFINEYLPMQPKDDRYYNIKYEVATKDGSEFTSHDSDMFKEHSILDIKVIKSLKMRFSTGGEESIWVDLTDSNLMRYNASRISVEGSNSTWVNGTFSKLLDCLDSWQNQTTTVIKWRWPISFGIIYLIGLAIVSLISAFTNVLENPLSSPGYAAIPIGGFGFSILIAEYLTGFWPELEIVPAQKHEQQVQKRRGRLKYILTGIIIPLILALIVGHLTR